MEDVKRHASPLFSIIIPVKEVDAYTHRLLEHIEWMTLADYEVLLITDIECDGFPAQKRNWGLAKAKGSLIAFIDNDAYPSPYWLSEALIYLNSGYVGVCGPGVLPPDASWLERCSDLVYRILPFSYRVFPKKSRIVTDYPTFNLIVKKNAIPKGGFENFLTGEDTLLCQAVSKVGDIIYTPDVLVYHNRRPLGKLFWKQVGTYGYHRGWLLKMALFGLIGTMFHYGINFVRAMFGKTYKGRG